MGMFTRAQSLLRHQVLGQEALYRAVDVIGELVELEVVSAPGLEPGTRLRVTKAAVSRMSVVEQAGEAPAAGRRAAVSERDIAPAPGVSH
jgi:hypothetical protein